MTETKHTPGPWKARKGFHADTIEIFHPDKSVKPPFYPCEIATIASDRDTAKAKANARLIATAPELLEALRMWLDIHETPAGFAGKYGKAFDDALAAQQLKVDAAASAARAAIAKSTGGAA